MAQILAQFRRAAIQKLRALIPQRGATQIFLTIAGMADNFKNLGTELWWRFFCQRLCEILSLGVIALFEFCDGIAIGFIRCALSSLRGAKAEQR